MRTVKRVAVLGAGTMGSRIAAHFANAGIPVLLLDIVVPDQPNRSVAAQRGIENAAKQRITPAKTGARLFLKKSDLLLKPIQELRGVLVIGSNAYQLRAPVIARVALK